MLQRDVGGAADVVRLKVLRRGGANAGAAASSELSDKAWLNEVCK
jgi:hypothetical protein